jgi:hypothetical protein
MPRTPPQPPSVTGPEAGPAKPSAPGPKEPRSIAASIVPQRKRDARRHPRGDNRPPEALRQLDDMAAAAEIAVETSRPDHDEQAS